MDIRDELEKNEQLYTASFGAQFVSGIIMPAIMFGFRFCCSAAMTRLRCPGWRITRALQTACGGSDDPVLPTLTAATPATLVSCTDLATKAVLANTTIASATLVAAGGLSVAGVTTPMPEHCLVKGEMNRRTSAVDGKSYAIGFEMRLPTAWNGRYFYQANGGIDGTVVTATGPVGGGAPETNALQMGFAVLSSDAGHSGAPWWAIDPQARLDYGYQAVGTLTPMAKNLIKTAYGKTPDRSYFGGCSNGGRHALIAAARYSDQYDGILAGAPGFHLPKAATAQLWKVQQYASIASSTVVSVATTSTVNITGLRIIRRGSVNSSSRSASSPHVGNHWPR